MILFPIGSFGRSVASKTLTYFFYFNIKFNLQSLNKSWVAGGEAYNKRNEGANSHKDHVTALVPSFCFQRLRDFLAAIQVQRPMAIKTLSRRKQTKQTWLRCHTWAFSFSYYGIISRTQAEKCLTSLPFFNPDLPSDQTQIVSYKTKDFLVQ